MSGLHAAIGGLIIACPGHICDYRRVAWLLGAAEAVRNSVGSPPGARDEFETLARAGRAELGHDAFQTQWAAGRSSPLNQAIAGALAIGEMALKTHRNPVGRSLTAAGPTSLTKREREVAVLIAQGLTNRQIADELVLSERTVGNHVEHILNKLGMTTRTQIGVWITEREAMRRPRSTPYPAR